MCIDVSELKVPWLAYQYSIATLLVIPKEIDIEYCAIFDKSSSVDTDTKNIIQGRLEKEELIKNTSATILTKIFKVLG